MKFSNEELKMLSDGVIALVCNASRAKQLVPDRKSLNAINEYIDGLQSLNSKLCEVMKEKEQWDLILESL